jgi:hypothetical protein
LTRQPDFRTAPSTSRVPLWQHLALAACALGALAAAAQAYATREEARGAARRLAEVSREVDAARARLLALEARARVAGAGVLSPADVPPALVVAEIASVLPDDVRLERLRSATGVLELLVVAPRRRGVGPLPSSSKGARAKWTRAARAAEVQPVRARALAPMTRRLVGRLRRGIALGITLPARRVRDESRAAFAQRREERERLRVDVARLERRASEVRVGTPDDAAAAARALRLSLLAATHGLGISDVQIASHPERRGTTAARGRLVGTGRQPDVLHGGPSRIPTGRLLSA